MYCLGETSIRDYNNQVTNLRFRNLSSKRFSASEIFILGHSVKFAPTYPAAPSAEQFRPQLLRFFRSMHLRAYFSSRQLPEDTTPPRFRIPRPNFNPQHTRPDYIASQECQQIEQYHEAVSTDISSLLNSLPKRIPNFKSRHRTANDNLFATARSADSTIMFVEADKGLGLVAIDRPDYCRLTLHQLQTTHIQLPTATSRDLILQGLDRLRTLVNMLGTGQPKWLITWLQIIISGIHPQTGHRFTKLPFFRLLLKLNKTFKSYPWTDTPLPGLRGLSGNHIHFTQPVSDVLEFICLPYVRTTASYIKDSDTVIHRFSTKQVPSHTHLFTFDIVALYDRIPHADLIDAVQHTLLSANDTLAYIASALLRFVLDHNYCVFGSDIWRQIRGIAMGISCAGSTAHLFLERIWFSLFQDDRLLFSGRYIDDGIGIFTGSTADLYAFLQLVHSAHPTIDITTCVNHFYVVFLDIVFFRGPKWHATGILDTDMYSKPSNQHLFFCFKSEHPAACKRGLVISELGRFIKRSSNIADYYGHAVDLWYHLRARGFPVSFLAECYDHAPDYSDRNKLLLNSISTKPDTDHNKAPFCFVTDYSLRKSRMNIAGALHANANLLPASLQQPRRLVAWKSAPKLRNLVTFRYNFPLLDEDGNLLPSS